MKLFKSMILCSVGALMTLFSGCSDWLDVNVDPENPTAGNATYDSRLAHIEFYTNSATQFAAWRSSMSMGDWTRYYDGGTYWNMSYWSPQTGAVTTPYQWWFCGAAVNIPFLIDKATAAEAWHYVGAARVIRAYGFMLMTDLYGEMPYKSSEAEAGVTPTYNDGKTIYLGCLADLDTAIEMFQKEQGSATASLAVGDIWNGGSVDKWLKLAYLLKARYINKLIKKGEGSYLEGKYDAAEILACLDKAQQSNAEYTQAILKDKPHFHISFIMNVSPECDCWNHNDAAIIPDLGILASFDPVALDKACADMVIAAPAINGSCLTEKHPHEHLEGADKFHLMHPDTNWQAGLEHAQKIGLGVMQYELITV